MNKLFIALFFTVSFSLPVFAETGSVPETVFLEMVNFSENLQQCVASRLYTGPTGLNDISAIELGEKIIIKDINTQSRVPYGTRKAVVTVRYDIKGLIYTVQVFKAESGSWRRTQNLGDFKFVSESDENAICSRIAETTIMGFYK